MNSFRKPTDVVPSVGQLFNSMHHNNSITFKEKP